MLYTTKDQTFGGVPIQQTWSALWLLEKVLTEFRPATIIEIGTGYGALTDFFTLHASEVITFDTLDRVNFKGKATYVIADVFQEETILRIKGLIKEADDVFLFCDGGNKIKEFEIFSPFLKVGDMIFLHDWGVEVKQKDIDIALVKGNFEPVELVKCWNLNTLLRGYRRKEK